MALTAALRGLASSAGASGLLLGPHSLLGQLTAAAGTCASGSLLQQQRAASSHAENTNTFLREVRAAGCRRLEPRALGGCGVCVNPLSDSSACLGETGGKPTQQPGCVHRLMPATRIMETSTLQQHVPVRASSVVSRPATAPNAHTQPSETPYRPTPASQHLAASPQHNPQQHYSYHPNTSHNRPCTSLSTLSGCRSCC